MKKRLAIFDLDGTLLDTIADLTNCCNHALEAFGHPTHTAEEYRMMVGRGIPNLIRSSMPEALREDEDAFTRVLTVFQRYYNVHSADFTRPYPGVTELLEAIRKGGVKTAVLSNKAHVFAVPMVEGYFPGLIDLTLGKREGVPLKPDPAAVGHIMAHFALERADCVYIGDSDIDMQTGRNAGLFTVGVTWGYRTKDILESAGASVIVDKVEDLISILLDK